MHALVKNLVFACLIDRYHLKIMDNSIDMMAHIVRFRYTAKGNKDVWVPYRITHTY